MRLGYLTRRYFTRHGDAAKESIIGIQTLGRLSTGPFHLGLLELRRNCPHDTGRDLILKLKNLLQVTLEAVGPQMGSCGSFDKLSCNSEAAGSFPYATFENVSHTQLSPDLLHVNRTPLVRE